MKKLINLAQPALFTKLFITYSCEKENIYCPTNSYNKINQFMKCIFVIQLN